MSRKLLLLVLTLILSSAAPAANLSISCVSATHNRTLDSIEITTTGWVQAKGLLLDNQLVISFPGTAISSEVALNFEPKSTRIISLEAQPDKRRLIVHLKKDVDYEIINVFGRDHTVVEIYDRVDYTAELMAAWEKANLAKKGEELKPFKFEPTVGRDQPLRGKIIVIDPGHGGNDPGAFSASGIPEKMLTLQTAIKTAKLLQRAGATVYLTRRDDRRYNLRDIVDFANKSGADIFLCIHYNASRQGETAGTETFYYRRESLKLAVSLHEALVVGLKRKDRGLHRAMFYTVHHTEMPAVLLEPLYLSNGEEEKLAANAAFQEQIAYYIYQGVKNYF